MVRGLSVKEGRWVCTPVGPPHAGRVIGVWFLVDGTVKAEGFYSRIPGLLKLAIGTWNAI